VAYVNQRRQRSGQALFEPLYTMRDALDAIDLFVTVGYDRLFEVVPGITATFRDAGHILGSANVTVDVSDQGQTTRVVFSGDVGRGGLAIVRDPVVPDGAEILVLESTYGGRVHESSGEALATLQLAVRETCVDRRGKLIIPSFAMGRTQEVIYRLNAMWQAGQLPHIDVYVDSPLAVNLTEVFRLHPECYDADMREAMARDPDGDPLGFSALTYVRSVEHSKALNALAGPAIIVSASGMCESGRILHHLANSIDRPANGVLFVGYQAEDTLGRRIQQGASPVRILGEEYAVRARIYSVEGYSAHADREELAAWAAQVKDAGRLRRVCLVHGEEPAINALAQRLTAEGLPHVGAPAPGDVLEL
jgi:metallo-beta-lactamase family protein